MKIITAIGSVELNESLKEIENVEVIGKDIQYQEGILEVLEKNENIDMLAVSNLLPEEMNFLYLIDKIRKTKEELEIVVFLDKENISIENFLNSKKIYKIYYLDENGVEVFINSLKNSNNVSLGISKEIEEIKNMIITPRFKKNYKNKQMSIESNLIAITGNPGSGKSIISCILAKQLEKKKKKVALISFDKTMSLKVILGTNNEENSINRNNISNYLSVFTYDFTFKDNLNERYEINDLIEKLKSEFDYIIFDISAEYQYINLVLQKSKKAVFLLEPNLLEVMKAKQYLETIIYDLDINEDKIKIVFNKTNRYQIAESILEEVFKEFEKIGSISYDEKYNLFINQHLSLLDDINLYEIIYEN